ncbi:DMT family transporter [Sulfobacillus thermosulfidooxidans]|uniref:DMT family transporter n=1 Tax=Sulfobacillus thermosulfidooxidans TaxID=28034 RepID=UPI0006B6565B|nr:DMT family transporter [Sulfobacillus thermosulfidooxidans]
MHPKRLPAVTDPRRSAVPSRAVAALVTTAIIWGSMYVVSRLVLDHVSVILLVWLRLVIAAVLLGPWAARWQFWRVSRQQLGLLAVIGLIGYSVSLPLLYLGLAATSAAMASLISSLSPVFIVLLSLMTGQRASMRNVIALLLAFLGVVLIVGINVHHRVSGTGIGALGLAAIAWAMYTVLNQHLKTLALPVVIFWELVFGATALTPWVLVAGAWTSLLHSSLTLWLQILYLGAVAMALAFLLWSYGFAHLTAGQGATFYFIQPLVGTGLSVVVLHETVSVPEIVGGTLIILSTVMATSPLPRRTRFSASRGSRSPSHDR